MEPRYIGSSYHETNWDRKKFANQLVAVEKSVKFLETEFGPVSVAVCGLSGALLGHALALKGVPVTLVRKENESSHGTRYEGHQPERCFVILDDLMSSGRTVAYIYRQIREYRDYDGSYHKLLCLLMYSDFQTSGKHPQVPTFHVVRDSVLDKKSMQQVRTWMSRPQPKELNLIP